MAKKDALDEAQGPEDAQETGRMAPKSKKADLGYNKEYEEWKVDPSPVRNDRDEIVEYSFEKIKKVKNVRIEPKQALRLNDQSVNSKMRYYAVGEDN